MPPQPLTNFEIQKYYQNEPRFDDVYSRINLPKVKDGAYAINIAECKSIGAHWIALYVKAYNDATYINSFGVEHIPKEINTFTGNENFTTNFFRIQALKVKTNRNLLHCLW